MWLRKLAIWLVRPGLEEWRGCDREELAEMFGELVLMWTFWLIAVGCEGIHSGSVKGRHGQFLGSCEREEARCWIL
jgi:hypothetical protein